MPQFSSGQLALVVIVTLGCATGLIAGYGPMFFQTLAPLAVILAALWALACAAVARLSNRAALLSTPAIAAFVLCVVVVVSVFDHHRRFMGFALGNACVSAVLLWVAIQFDTRPKA